MEDMRGKRKILFIGHVVQLPKGKCQQIALTSSVEGNRKQGRPFRTTRDECFDNFKQVVSNLSNNGNVT